jgi:hypothetical protein
MKIELSITKENGKIFLGVYLNAKDNDPYTYGEIFNFCHPREKVHEKFLDITENTGCVFNIFLFYRVD